METRFYYAGDREIEERNGSGSTLATYVYGNYIDEVLSMKRGGYDYFYLQDDLFNVMRVTDANGTVVDSIDYGDFGTPIVSGSSGNPYLFNGRRYDPESGLYYYRTRYLAPALGRFTTRDTIGIWGDPNNFGNPYTYVANAPWTWVDPWGVDSLAPSINSLLEDQRNQTEKWKNSHMSFNNCCDISFILWIGLDSRNTSIRFVCLMEIPIVLNVYPFC